MYLEVGVLGPNGPNVTLNVGVASKNGPGPAITPPPSITVQAVKVLPLKRSPVLNFARLLMGPGVRGPRGLPAVPIVCNLDVGTVIILNLQTGDDTARAMIWPAETVPVACVNLVSTLLCFMERNRKEMLPPRPPLLWLAPTSPCSLASLWLSSFFLSLSYA